MKHFFLVLLAKCGFIMSGVGQLKLNSAVSGFVKAQTDLQDAIKFEATVILKTEEDIEKLRLNYERKQNDLKDRKIMHDKISRDSTIYLKRITEFLSIEEDPGYKSIRYIDQIVDADANADTGHSGQSSD